VVYRRGSAQGTQIADAVERVRFTEEEFNLISTPVPSQEPHKNESHPQVAFSYGIRLNYEIKRRRSMPAAPRMPVPSNIRLDGSGTGDVEEVRSKEPVFI
jgi:hypothetical protein